MATDAPGLAPGAAIEILCRVVDNFGDAGVAWRLASILATEHGFDVTLRIDDPATLARIAPPGAPVRIATLGDSPPEEAALPALIVDAFGGGLPDAWLERLAQAPRPPAWITLEYLSAERWVDDAHGKPSPHPRFALTRWYCFPGFSARTGGLLRERDLLVRRDAFAANVSAQDAFWRWAGLPPPDAGELSVSLFCYLNPALPALLRAWSDGAVPMRLVVPEGVADAAIAEWAGARAVSGTAVTRGALTIARVPFVPQPAFDERLWACDLSFVRGEDSFVRAQWAAKPFVWHIYPQDDAAHRAKLDAFLDRYADGLDAMSARALGDFWHAFNGGDARDTLACWGAFSNALPALGRHGRRWCATIGQLPELAASVVQMARNRL